MSENKISEIMIKYPKDRAGLIAILQDINKEFCYLNKENLKEVAKYVNLPFAEVYRVATFYKVFSIIPKGKKRIRVCMGTACHVRGSQNILSEFERVLNIKSGETTADLKYSLETVNCVGACSMAPIAVINEDYFSDVKPNRVKKIMGIYIS